uniref:C2H2-type domain-containing protein n=2 Tax=Sipha flava TaxID=143950 RepID=A0A2S2Q306_9HEMI
MVKTSKKKNKKPGLFEEKTKMVKTSKKKNIKTEIKKLEMEEISWDSNEESEDDDMIGDDDCKDPDYVIPGVRNRNISSISDEDCVEPKEDNNDENDEQSRNDAVTVQPQAAEKSIKVTLKKTRSCSSSSSRESTQSFKVVRSDVLNESKSVSGEDGDNENENDKVLPEEEDENKNNSEDNSEISTNNSSSNKNFFNDIIDNIIISSDDSEKSFFERSSTITPVKNENKEENPTCVNYNIEISSDESEKSFSGRSSPVVPVKDEKKDDKTISVVSIENLKTENTLQNSSMEKKEECKLKVKLLKEEFLKEDNDEIVITKNDVKDGVTTSKSQNEAEVKEPVKELKFKVNVRSSDELYAPHKSNLINIPPVQLDGQPNFLSQNGAPFPLPQFVSCDVCGIQFDSAELLGEHKVAMKHFKCTFKECEHLVLSSQQEFLDHQRLIHSIMPSPVQQLAHQVQSLPTMGFDQILQSGVPPLPDNLPPRGIPNLYTQSLRMPSQPVPMQRSIRPIIRPNTSHLSTRGRNILRGTRGRPVSMNTTRGGSIKRPASMPLRGSPALKRTPTDRSYSNNLKQSPQVVKCLSQSLTKPVSSAHKSLPNSSQQDVVNLFSKRGLTISTVETSGKNSVNLPLGVSLNSAVTIIPTSPLKSVDTVDLTGPEPKLWPCEVCSKTYTTIDLLYEHVSTLHKSHIFSYKCNLCKSSFPNPEMLRRHKLVNHKQETNSSIPFVIPILDITNSSTVAKLQSMGVTNYVPVAQLDSHGSQYGMPIMNISRPGTIDGLKYTNFFNLGSIRKL